MSASLAQLNSTQRVRWPSDCSHEPRCWHLVACALGPMCTPARARRGRQGTRAAYSSSAGLWPTRSMIPGDTLISLTPSQPPPPPSPGVASPENR